MTTLHAVSSHSLAFLPSAEYWSKMLASDVFVHTSGEKYSKNLHLNRTKVGENLAVIPVVHTSGPCLKDVLVDPHFKLSKLAKMIRQTYMTRRQPYGSRLEPVIASLELLERKKTERLLDVLLLLTDQVARMLIPPDSTSKHVVCDLSWDESKSERQRLETLLESAVPDLEGHYLTSRLESWAFGAGLKKFEILEQVLTREVKDETVLQLIATEPDPYDYLMTLSKWEPKFQRQILRMV